MQIHESAEDYLEAILMLKERKGAVRSIDIANELEYTKPSVSVAMKKLREKLAEEGFPNAPIEDVLSYASFPEVTLNFLRHSNIGMKFHDL